MCRGNALELAITLGKISGLLIKLGNIAGL